MTITRLHITSAATGIVLSIVIFFFSPETVAMHFNFAGQADSFTSRSSNLILWVVLFIFLNALWLMIPFLVKIVPASMVNIPNREYWLAPERRDATIGKITRFMGGFGILTNIYLCIINVVIFSVIASGDTQLNRPAFITALAAFLIAVIVWIVFFVRSFRKTKDA